MRKGRDGGGKKTGKQKLEKKEREKMKIVATTSLPAVDRPNADRWNGSPLPMVLKLFIYHLTL